MKYTRNLILNRSSFDICKLLLKSFIRTENLKKSMRSLFQHIPVLCDISSSLETSQMQDKPNKPMRSPILMMRVNLTKCPPNSTKFEQVRPGSEFELQYVLAPFKLVSPKMYIRNCIGIYSIHMCVCSFVHAKHRHRPLYPCMSPTFTNERTRKVTALRLLVPRANANALHI